MRLLLDLKDVTLGNLAIAQGHYARPLVSDFSFVVTCCRLHVLSINIFMHFRNGTFFFLFFLFL